MKRYSKTIWAAGLVIVLIGTLVVTAYAQNPRRLGQGRILARNAQARPLALARGLNLTQDQKDQIKTILANHKEEIKIVAQDNAKARKEFATAMAGGTDVQALKVAYDKVSDAGWNRVLARTKIGAEIKTILTPEQIQQLEKRKRLIGNLTQRLINRRDQ